MPRQRNRTTFVVLGLMLWLPALPTLGAWVIEQVPMQPGWDDDVEPRDINSSGVICGHAITSAGPRVAFRYDGTTVTELPPLTTGLTSLATGINASGAICGYSYRPDNKERAVYWEGTTLYTVPYVPDANTNSYCQALDINDHGVIVGFYWKPDGSRTAFYYKDGVSYSLDGPIRSLGLTDMQIARGVNNGNVVCGTAHDALGVTTAYTYDIDTGVATLIGRIGSADVSAWDINKYGHIVGRGKRYSWDPYFHALLYDGSWSFVDEADTAHQRVGGLNDLGRIVAYSGGYSDRLSWYSDAPGPNSRIYFDFAGWTTLNTQEVNNLGWVVGYGRTDTSGDEERGFIIKPPPGDTDQDGDVDLYDFGRFQTCFAPAGPVGPGCGEFDFDEDDNVDLDDYAILEGSLQGPGV